MSIPDPIAIWVELLDQAEYQMATASPSDRYAMARVGQTLDRLMAHEHTLTPSDRVTVRLFVWSRDHPDRSLPDAAWEAWAMHCQCRSCAYARRAAVLAAYAPDGQVTTWQAQLAVVHRQASSTQKGKHP